MIYSVDVGGTRVALDITPDGVRIDGGNVVDAELTEIPGSPLARLRLGTSIYEVLVRRGREKGQYTLLIGANEYPVEALDERARAIRSMTQAAARSAGPAPLRAPMPGLIVRVYVAVGETVQAGQPLVAMEAMKMENELRASTAGTVKVVHATPGTAVEKGSVLVEMS